MARIALTLTEQVKFLESVRRQLGITNAKMAGLCKVHPRTFSDWRRGKYRMRFESLQELIRGAKISIGHEIGQLPEFSHVRTAAHLGAMQRNRLYGNPGTPEGRRLGGLMSMRRRREAAQDGVPLDGFYFAKPILTPSFSPILAEFLGVMLGDGCLNSSYQAALYFNSETDVQYADFMEKLSKQLFGIIPKRSVEPGSKAGTLLFSSKRFVDYLIQIGFKRGDKVRNQAGVPLWILDDANYRKHCLRGLMDTDGSVYLYTHQVYGKTYTHLALAFTNRSYPLLQFVKETLFLNGYHPVMRPFQVYLHRRIEIERYFSDIGTHNAKYLQRYQAYLQNSNGHSRRGIQVVDGVALEKR